MLLNNSNYSNPVVWLVFHSLSVSQLHTEVQQSLLQIFKTENNFFFNHIGLWMGGDDYDITKACGEKV